jgi:hypothetical protein
MAVLVDPKVCGWLLIAGLVVFFVGAAAWSLGFQASALTETLRNVANAPLRWWWIHGWMAAGVVVTGSGLIAWTEIQRQAGERLATPIALAMYWTGAVLWLVAIALRVTVQNWAADEVMAGNLPAVYPPLHRFAGALYSVHMILSYLSAVVLGAGVLRSGLPSVAVGWAGVVGGSVFAAGFIVARGGLFGMPFLAHVYTCVLGVALLRIR